MGPLRRRPTDCAPSLSPCDRAFGRRLPALFRREPSGRGGRGGKQLEPLYGLTNFTAANRMESAVGGGEAGVASGFGVAALFRLNALTAATAYLLERWAGSAGWSLLSTGAFLMKTGVGNAQVIAGRTFTASDVGKIFLLVGRHSGATNLNQLYADRGLNASVAQPSFVAATSEPMALGAHHSGVAPADNVSWLSTLTFRGTPSDAQIVALFDATRVRGDMPDTFDGATITHRWSVRDETRDKPNPAGRKTYGARRLSAANYLESAVGLAGAASGFWFSWLGVYDTSFTLGVLAGKRNASVPHQGYNIAIGGTSVFFECSNGAGGIPNASGAIEVSNVPRVVTGLMTGAVLRLYLDGVKLGADVACAGFTPAAMPFRVGVSGDGLYPQGGVGWMGDAGGLGVPSAQQIADHAAATLASGRMQAIPGLTSMLHDPTAAVGANEAGGVPAVVADSAGASPLTRVGTLELAISVAKGPACPAQLTDTITRASVDALARVGSPQVVTIDPSVDGRRTLGAQGFSAANSLNSAGGTAGINGHATLGVTVAQVLRFDSLTGNGISAHKLGDNGWAMQSVGASLLFFTRKLGASVGSSSYTLTAADLGQPVLAFGVHTGTVVRLYVKFAGRPVMQVGTDVVAGFAPETLIPMQVGAFTGQPFDKGSVFALQGGNRALTLSEITQVADEWERTGKLNGLGADHLYDLTADILASGVEAVPAQVLDRIGSDHLTRVNAQVSTSGNFRGLSGMNGSSRLARPPQLGHLATSFWTLLAVRVDQQGGSLASRFRTPYHNRRLSPSKGFDWIMSGRNDGVLAFESTSGAGVLGNASTFSLAGVAGQTLLAVGIHDVTTGKLRAFINGVSTGADVDCAGYTPSSELEMVGVDYTGSYICDGMTVFAVGGGQGVTPPTQAELVAQNAVFQATGVVPEIPGKITTLVNFKPLLSSGDVPATLPDEKAGIAAFVSSGFGGLALAQRTERVYSWETSPIMYGTQIPSASDYWSRPDGFAGDPAGFMVELLYMPLALTAGTRIIAGKRGTMGGADPSFFKGWHIATTGVNNLLSFACGGSTNAGSPNPTVSSADIGKLFLFTGVWDAAAQRVRAYCRRVEQGTGTALTSGFQPNTVDPFTLGRRSDGFPATDMKIFGFRAGNFIPTLAEVQSATDAVMAHERMQQSDYQKPLACMYRFPDGVVPSVLTDLIGNAHLALAGSPTMHGQYARAWSI